MGARSRCFKRSGGLAPPFGFDPFPGRVYVALCSHVSRIPHGWSGTHVLDIFWFPEYACFAYAADGFSCEPNMRVISRRPLDQFAKIYPDAKTPLEALASDYRWGGVV